MNLTEKEAMNWQDAVQLGCADATEQRAAWAEIERLREFIRYEYDQLLRDDPEAVDLRNEFPWLSETAEQKGKADG